LVGAVFSGFRGFADLMLAGCLLVANLCLDGSFFSEFIVSADLILQASFSQAEKEERVGGLAFELEAGAGFAHGFGPWAGLGGWLPAGFEIFGNGCAALNPGWRLVELALPWAKIYNPYRVDFVPSKQTHPLSPSRSGRGE
jgi:hypothetical protein